MSDADKKFLEQVESVWITAKEKTVEWWHVFYYQWLDFLPMDHRPYAVGGIGVVLILLWMHFRCRRKIKKLWVAGELKDSLIKIQEGRIADLKRQRDELSNQKCDVKQMGQQPSVPVVFNPPLTPQLDPAKVVAEMIVMHKDCLGALQNQTKLYHDANQINFDKWMNKLSTIAETTVSKTNALTAQSITALDEAVTHIIEQSDE